MADPQKVLRGMNPDTNYLSGTAVPGQYRTALAPLDEFRFRAWVKYNRIPFDDSPQSDYDMRGYWKAQMSGDPRAQTQVNQFDGRPHFPDTWKTPYHQTFSNESIYANPHNAPRWVGDRLVDKLGIVLADETPK